MQTDPSIRCVHLRAKAMYAPAGMPETDADEAEAPVCWCNRTLRELGPDGEPAETAPCCDPARGCYQSQANLRRPA